MNMKILQGIAIGIIAIAAAVYLIQQISGAGNGSNYVPETTSSYSSKPYERKAKADPIATQKSREKANPMSHMKPNIRFESESYQKGKGILKIRTDKKYKHYVYGNLYNNANYATYKNAIIEVTYRDNSGRTVGTQRFNLNKYFSPKKGVSFKFLMTPPSNAAKWSGHLVSIATVD